MNDNDKFEDIDNKIEDLEIKIEVPDINDSVNVLNHNSEDTNIWGRECTNTSAMYTACIKHEESTLEKEVLNDINEKKDNQIKYVGIKVEEPNISRYLDEDKLVSINMNHSNIIDPTVCNHNDVWSREYSYSSMLNLECIKCEKSDLCEPTLENETLIEYDEKKNNIDIEITDKNTQNAWRESCSNEFVIQAAEQMITESTDKNLNNYVHQINADSENMESNYYVSAHHYENDEQSKCAVFDEELVTSDDLENAYMCNMCDKWYTRSSHLVRHKLIHQDDKRYKCDVCDKGFTESSNLVRHKLTHTGEKPYQCDVCNRRFSQKSNLIKHKLTHTDVKPHNCDICNKGFIVLHSLVTHKLTHTGEKPYKCDVCNKGFTKISRLKTHKLLHTVEKPYKCDVCNKGFTISRCLTRHKLTHTGDKPYKCDVCNRAFTESCNLERHKVTHTGEKPYTCDVCNRAFTQVSNLVKHKLTKQHKDQLAVVINLTKS